MDEEDLDALLAHYREEWEQQHSTTEEQVVSIPSRRANATYVGHVLTQPHVMPFGQRFMDVWRRVL